MMQIEEEYEMEGGGPTILEHSSPKNNHGRGALGKLLKKRITTAVANVGQHGKKALSTNTSSSSSSPTRGGGGVGGIDVISRRRSCSSTLSKPSMSRDYSGTTDGAIVQGYSDELEAAAARRLERASVNATFYRGGRPVYVVNQVVHQEQDHQQQHDHRLVGNRPQHELVEMGPHDEEEGGIIEGDGSGGDHVGATTAAGATTSPRRFRRGLLGRTRSSPARGIGARRASLPAPRPPPATTTMGTGVGGSGGMARAFASLAPPTTPIRKVSPESSPKKKKSQQEKHKESISTRLYPRNHSSYSSCNDDGGGCGPNAPDPSGDDEDIVVLHPAGASPSKIAVNGATSGTTTNTTSLSSPKNNHVGTTMYSTPPKPPPPSPGSNVHPFFRVNNNPRPSPTRRSGSCRRKRVCHHVRRNTDDSNGTDMTPTINNLTLRRSSSLRSSSGGGRGGRSGGRRRGTLSSSQGPVDVDSISLTSGSSCSSENNNGVAASLMPGVVRRANRLPPLLSSDKSNSNINGHRQYHSETSDTSFLNRIYNLYIVNDDETTSGGHTASTSSTEDGGGASGGSSRNAPLPHYYTGEGGEEVSQTRRSSAATWSSTDSSSGRKTIDLTQQHRRSLTSSPTSSLPSPRDPRPPPPILLNPVEPGTSPETVGNMDLSPSAAALLGQRAGITVLSSDSRGMIRPKSPPLTVEAIQQHEFLYGGANGGRRSRGASFEEDDQGGTAASDHADDVTVDRRAGASPSFIPKDVSRHGLGARVPLGNLMNQERVTGDANEIINPPAYHFEPIDAEVTTVTPVTPGCSSGGQQQYNQRQNVVLDRWREQNIALEQWERRKQLQQDQTDLITAGATGRFYAAAAVGGGATIHSIPLTRQNNSFSTGNATARRREVIAVVLQEQDDDDDLDAVLADDPLSPMHGAPKSEPRRRRYRLPQGAEDAAAQAAAAAGRFFRGAKNKPSKNDGGASTGTCRRRSSALTADAATRHQHAQQALTDKTRSSHALLIESDAGLEVIPVLARKGFVHAQ